MNQKQQHTETVNKEKLKLENPDLTYDDLKPVLEEYGLKVKSYKTTRNLLKRGLYSWVTLALKTIFSGKKGESEFGCLMLYLLIGGPIMAYQEYPTTTIIIFVLGILLYLSFWIYARVSFHSFKVDLIQALFMDNDIAVDVKPKKHITKHHFNSTGLFGKAIRLSGEDCVHGSTTDFHFVFSELKAKGSLSWEGFDNLFEGLYFYGTWDKSPFTSNFRIKQRGLLDTFAVTTTSKFERYFQVLDEEGNEINNQSKIDEIPFEFKRDIIDLIKKYKCKLEVVYNQGQILVLLHGSRDYFPLEFEDSIESKETFQLIAKDVLLFRDLIKILSRQNAL